MQCENFIEMRQVRFVNITMQIIEQVTKSSHRAAMIEIIDLVGQYQHERATLPQDPSPLG